MDSKFTDINSNELVEIDGGLGIVASCIIGGLIFGGSATAGYWAMRIFGR